MVLEFYYDMVSEPCRAIYLFLKRNKVPFEPKEVSIIKGDHYKPDYVQKNPWKKVPTIIDDGFVLSESAAILRYLVVKYDVAEHLYPRKDVRKTAKIDEFLHWHHLALRRPMIDILLGLLLSRVGLNEHYPKIPLDEEKVNKAKVDYKAALNHLADYYIRDQYFIGGDDISVADLLAFCYLVNLEVVSMQELYESHPKISAYVKRVEAKLQPYFEETCDVYRDVKKHYDEGRSYY